MAREGWQRLLAGVSGTRKRGDSRIMAYSEFMPPPRIAWKPYGGTEPTPFADDDPFGWQITEYEEAVELQPGLAHVAQHVVRGAGPLGPRPAGPRHHQGKAGGQPLLAAGVGRAGR